MPSKILRDEEGNEFRFHWGTIPELGELIPIPKPELTLEEKIRNWERAPGEFDHIELAKIIIAEIGRIYNLERKDGK